MTEENVMAGIRDIYTKALAEAILFLWHTASVTENNRIEVLLKTSFEDLMKSVYDIDTTE